MKDNNSDDILFSLRGIIGAENAEDEVTPEMRESVMEGQVMFSKKKKKASETASVTSDEAHQPTVASNAYGANRLKNSMIVPIRIA